MTQLDYRPPSPAFSIPSIIAIVCAIWSFFAGAAFGLVLAIIAIVAGALGTLLAVAPSRRGGMASLFAIGAGVLGIVAAIFKLIF